MIVIFVTDGLPTIGVTDVDEIIRDLASRKRAAARFPMIHVIGVGSDVNTRLLDSMSELSSASRAYVEPGEDIRDEVGDLYDRIQSTVLTDLRLETPGLVSYGVFPATLPPLHEGRQLVVTGRYRAGGKGAVKVTGSGVSGEVTLADDAEFPGGASREADFLPRLWAMRKLGDLLDAIRLRGENPEPTDEVVDLARRHGVVTPCTSSLVLESERMYRNRGIQRIRRRKDGTAAAPGGRPVFTHDEAPPDDHAETANSMDGTTARLQEDSIGDVPLGGTGVTGNLGVGGGSAGTYGFRLGGGRRRAALRGGATTPPRPPSTGRWSGSPGSRTPTAAGTPTVRRQEAEPGASRRPASRCWRFSAQGTPRRRASTGKSSRGR
jgi:Ca-activated chloride channel family protein